MLSSVLEKLFRREELALDEMQGVMNDIMDGRLTPAQTGAFLTALRMKGETVGEITAAAHVMRDKAVPVSIPGYSIDTCGTGGDRAQTFNISTGVAFVAAAAGVQVVKHGNRSVSSRSGSADVLEALGVYLSPDPANVRRSVEEVGFGFLFAPHFHQAMKHVVGPRRELGVRTIFNILGPLTNPARVQGQVLGVFDPKLPRVMAGVLANLDVERAMVCHGLDGLDEITLTDRTAVSEVRDGEIHEYTLDPRDFGFSLVEAAALRGGSPADNAHILRGVLQGTPGPARDVTLLNAGAAIYVGRQADSMAAGVQLARDVLDSGRALDVLRRLVQCSEGFRAS